jgi:hypothetical protein
MTNVRLKLPAEVTSELELPYPDSRDINAVLVAIDGLNVAASVVTLTALRPQLASLARALRGWVLRQSAPMPIRLLVKGNGVDIQLELPPNVSTGEIMRVLQRLVDTGGS